MEAGNRIAVRVAEAAELLSIPKQRVYRLARSGAFPTYKLSHKTLLIPVSGLHAWLAEGGKRTRAPVASAPVSPLHQETDEAARREAERVRCQEATTTQGFVACQPEDGR